jgi:hypothetical protein
MLRALGDVRVTPVRLGALLLTFELLLCAFVIARQAYTEIDWQAYMQEVSGFLSGERNYLNLKTSWGSFGHGENGSLKFGDTRSWYTGERGLMCMDFPDTPQLNYFDENLDRNLP